MLNGRPCPCNHSRTRMGPSRPAGDLGARIRIETRRRGPVLCRLTLTLPYPECRMRLPSLLSVLAALLVSPLLRAEAPQPPAAARRPHAVVWHGQKVEDPFFWLREKSDPQVIKYLEAENAYTEAMTGGLKP